MAPRTRATPNPPPDPVPEDLQPGPANPGNPPPNPPEFPDDHASVHESEHEPDHSGSHTSPPPPEENVLAEVLKTLETLRKENEALRARLDTYTARDPVVTAPAKFDGKISEFRGFMNQCELVFELAPNTYRSDKQKVLFIASCMEKKARITVQPILENHEHPLRTDYQQFKKHLETLYTDHAFRYRQTTKLARLTQTGSASKFAEELEACWAALGVTDDQTKCMTFYEGLQQTLKNSLIVQGQKETWSELRKQAIVIDQRLYDANKPSESTNSNSKKRPHDATSESSASQPSKKPHVAYTSGTSTRATTSSKPPSKPSESGNTKHKSQYREPLSEEEKQRRRDLGLCTYCATKGHFAKECPNIKAPPKPSTVNITFTPAQTVSPPQPSGKDQSQ